MKKLTLMALAAMAFTSCTKEITPEVETPVQIAQDSIEVRSQYEALLHIVSDASGLHIQLTGENGIMYVNAQYGQPVDWTVGTCLPPQCYRLKVWNDLNPDSFYSVSVSGVYNEGVYAEVLSTDEVDTVLFCVERVHDYQDVEHIELSK